MKMLEKTAILAIGAGVLIASASAQELRTASENVVACQSVEDSAARLECFEAAASALSAALTAPVSDAVARAPTTPTAASPSVPAAPVETAAAAPPSTEQAGAAVETAATSTPADPNVSRSRLPSWIPRITFGSDREVEKEPDEYATQITRIRVNRLGRHFFTTTEGHVWRQRKIEEIRAPKSLPADATLYQNITGGLRIKIEETNRSYGVERIE